MNRQVVGPVRLADWALLLLVPVALTEATAAWAFDPESPRVQECVAKGIKYLETQEKPDRQLGARPLVGLALLKYGVKRDHPMVEDAVEKIRSALGPMDGLNLKIDIYTTGLSIIFLVELDPDKYRPEIECLLTHLQRVQKPHGGWGYLDQPTGDTSMTQYAVLSSWEAQRAGFDIPQESVERVCDWLLKTQDPSGAFGYQGQISTKPGKRVPQSDVRHSLAAAGLGSLYICGDLLGVNRKVEFRRDDIPAALIKVKTESEDAGADAKIATRINASLVHEAQNLGVRWMAANYRIDPRRWTNYYLYALERYQSFRELAEGRQEKEPRWYNDGVVYLRRVQNDNGSWDGEAKKTSETAFALLFLLRSSKKSIEKIHNFGDGTLVGGRGLPKQTDRVAVRQGKVVPRPLLGPAEQLLAGLENVEEADFEQTAAVLAELPPQGAEAVLARHAEKLRALAGDSSAEMRIAAVRALGKTRDLDDVPTLIYALTDPDWDVVREARDALRRTSRRPLGFGLADHATQLERREAIEKWKQWYLAIRPDGEFGD